MRKAILVIYPSQHLIQPRLREPAASQGLLWSSWGMVTDSCITPRTPLHQSSFIAQRKNVTKGAESVTAHAPVLLSPQCTPFAAAWQTLISLPCRRTFCH